MNLISILYDIIKLIAIIRLIGRLTRMKYIVTVLCDYSHSRYCDRSRNTAREKHRAKNAISASLITTQRTWEMFVGGSDNTVSCPRYGTLYSHRAASKIRRHNQTVAR